MIVTYMDQNRKWKWGYFEPKFFRVQGDRIVDVASTEPFDVSLQFAEAFATDDARYRDVFLVTCRVSREVCERILDDFIHFRHFGGHSGDTYFVYEFINNEEAKLVDDTSRIDYVLLTLGHGAESRAGCATIKLLSGDSVAWSDVKSTCCRIASSAVAMIIARYGSKLTIAKNSLPYRGCCEEWEIEEWESVFPPRRVAQYRTTEPVATSISPDEVA